MYEIRKTVQFDSWLRGIKDSTVQKRLLVRLRKASIGNLGDVRAVGAGWRMYFIIVGKVIVVMLGGGTKSTQSSDIKQAKKLLEDLED